MLLLPGTQAHAADNWIYYNVHKTQGWDTFLQRAGLTAPDIIAIEAALPNRYQTPARGERIGLLIRGGQVMKLQQEQSPLQTLVLSRQGDRFKATFNTHEVRHHSQLYIGTLNRGENLVEALQRKNLSASSLSQLKKILEERLNLQRLQPGTRFRLLHDQPFVDGKPWGEGFISALQISDQHTQQTAIRYQLANGQFHYFTPGGKPWRSGFLRAPLHYTHISSPFSTHRLHPVLGKVRPHYGVDLAAPAGTPVMASAAGEVIWVGRKSGYGKTIKLAHGNTIATLYAHLSRYRSNLKPGMLVKKGEVIGYVGKTGLATGPHLHYEFHRNGVAVNPMTTELPNPQLPVMKSEAFAASVRQALSKLRDPREVASTQNNRNPG